MANKYFFHKAWDLFTKIALIVGFLVGIVTLGNCINKQRQIDEDNKKLVDVKTAELSIDLLLRKKPTEIHADRQSVPQKIIIRGKCYFKNISQMNIDIKPDFVTNIPPPKGWKIDGKLWLEDVYNKSQRNRMDGYIFMSPGDEYPFTLELSFVPGYKDKSRYEIDVNTLPEVADLTLRPNFRLPTNISDSDEYYKFHVHYALREALHGRIGTIIQE